MDRSAGVVHFLCAEKEKTSVYGDTEVFEIA